MRSWNGQRIMLFLCCALVFSSVLHSQMHFTDVTQKYGVRGYDHFGGHGVCWGDVNGDGKLDIYVKNVAGWIYDVPNNLFINYGNSFLEEAAVRGATDAYGLGTHGAVLADLDSDGDFDLFSTTTFSITPARNHIYQNDGNGFFSDITHVISPTQENDTESRGVAAADFDGDGDIDLYFSDPLDNTDPFNPEPFPPKELKNFYINEGDGTFSTQYRGIPWTSFVQGVVSIDIDGDGDIDIAEARWTSPSTIYLNDGTGHFIDSGEVLGLPQTIGFRDNGLTFGDVDNDGDLDLAIMGEDGVILYQNTGGVFNWLQTIVPDPSAGGAHVCLGDFDNDGDIDLYVSGGNVYENDGQGVFTLVLSNISGLQPSLVTVDPRGCALGDFDGDGDLDIYITDADYYNVLLQNDCDNSNWIQVDVVDQNGGKGGLGVKLDLYLAGHLNETQFLEGHREIHGEYGYLGQDMPTVHFGAPAADQYDLKISFTDGVVETVKGISPGQKIQVAYPLPSIKSDKTSLSFQGVEGESNPVSQVFKVKNAGSGTLNYQINANQSWLSVSPASGSSTGEWDEIVVSIDISNLIAGTYKGAVSIKSAEASNSPLKISVKLTIENLPTLKINETSLSFQGVEGESNPVSQIFKIKNAGARTVNYQISTLQSWLSVFPASGRSTGEWDEIVVSVNISNLEAGIYTGTVGIESSEAGNSPLEINVKLTLAIPPIYAPLNFSGVRKENRALFYRESLILLNWKENPQNKNIQKYRIYIVGETGDTLLDVVSADNFNYMLQNADKNKHYLFALTAVDHKGREGEASHITVK